MHQISPRSAPSGSLRRSVLAGLFLLCSGTAASAQTCDTPSFSAIPITITAYTTANTCSPAIAIAATLSNPTGVSLAFKLNGATLDSGIGIGSGHIFNRGITHLTISASRACVTKKFFIDVIVKDTIKPVLSHANITVNAAPGLCGANVPYGAPSMTHNCPNCSFSFLQSLGFQYLGSFGGHEYFLTPKTLKANFDLIDAQAGTVGAHLASINSAAENAFLNAAIPDTVIAWFGYTDRDVEGTWKWTDGSTSTYTNWCDGEPDDFSGHQDYAIIHSGGIPGPAGCWDDAHLAFFPPTGALNNFQGIIELDICGTSLVKTAGLDSNAFFPVGVTKVTYKATDASGNSDSVSFNVTVIDTQNPVITCPKDTTLLANSTNTSPSVTGMATATDNCGVPTITKLDSVVGNVIYRKWIATDASGNVSTCTQKITVPSGNNGICGWILVAKRSIHLHENSAVLYGGVGVTDSSNDAKIHVEKKSSVPLPGFVMAKKIDIANDAVVDSAIYAPAHPPLPTMLFPSGASTSSLSNFTINFNGTYNSNYKDLTVNDGLTVTIGGTLYRKIKIKKNCVVTFSQSDITMESLDVDENVTLLYSGNTKMRVSDRVKLHKAATVNPAPSKKLVFYVDDPLSSNDNDDKFDVDGDGTSFVGSVMMPSGKLHVHGGGNNPSTTMKGFFYAERIESDGKNVTWLNDCANSPLRLINNAASNQSASGSAYGIMIYPNPAKGEFNMQFEQVTESADVRITDLQGRLVDARTVTVNQMPSASFNVSAWSTGVYLVEVRQGSLHKWTKLIVQ